MRKSTKRALISAGAAFGLKPEDPKWVAALLRLKGTFERTGFDLAFYVANLVWITAALAILGAGAFNQFRQWGWTSGITIFAIYGFGMLCLLYFLVSRASLRYVFGGGTVSAYNTWGQLLWSEDLTGLKFVTTFTGRGMTSMTLFWAERKRRMALFKSLRNAIDAPE
jgi:hypothetical protein